jgi:hypothetical protein
MHPQIHMIYKSVIVKSAGLCEFTMQNANMNVNNWKA